MKNLKNIFLTFTFTVFVFYLFACSKVAQSPNIIPDINHSAINSDSNPKLHGFDLAEFKRNKNLWKTKNIKNYKMNVEVRSMMYFGEQVLIEVENGSAKSMKLTLDGGHTEAEAYKDFNTVEKIFRVLERAVEAKAERLNVEYNNIFGYPSQILIDVNDKTEDDEMSIKIKNLEAIKEFRN